MTLDDDMIEQTADELAGAGDWTGVYRLLDAHRRSDLLADRRLAYTYAEALYNTGRFPELGAFAVEFEAAARDARDTRGVMHGIHLRGIARFELGDLDRAQSSFDALMDLAAAELDEDMMARAAISLGALANLRGRSREALGFYLLASALFERLRQTRGLSQTLHNIGISYRDMGRLADAVAAYQRASEYASGIGHTPQVVSSTIARAEVEAWRGDLALALELARRGLEQARELGDPVSAAEALRVRAMITLQQEPGSGERPLADLQEAARLASDTRSALVAAEVERDMGRVMLAVGKVEDARSRLQTAERRFEALGAELELASLREQLEALATPRSGTSPDREESTEA